MANSKLTKKKRVYLLFAVVAFIGLSNAAERCRKLAGKETSSKTGHFNIMYCLDGGSGSVVCAVKEAVKLYVYSIRTSHVERAKSVAMEGAMTDALSQGMSVKQANKEAQRAAARATRTATRQADRILGPIVSSGWDFLEAFYFGSSVTEGSLRSSGTLIGTYLVGFLGEQRFGKVGYFGGSTLGSWVGGKVGLMFYDLVNGIDHIIHYNEQNTIT
ncbi:hypothetical protein DM860_007449 [Cuscuta australis]|uniref:Uncharacterized protein n=1 Tax=Cuscuta australis TaxID=267555 RepID=A0A328E865_9ASTE|nr:hypothetical protein DM860_007449 [Cuscuta australis]